jgi:hypothetical protein
MDGIYLWVATHRATDMPMTSDLLLYALQSANDTGVQKGVGSEDCTVYVSFSNCLRQLAKWRQTPV